MSENPVCFALCRPCKARGGAPLSLSLSRRLCISTEENTRSIRTGVLVYPAGGGEECRQKAIHGERRLEPLQRPFCRRAVYDFVESTSERSFCAPCKTNTDNTHGRAKVQGRAGSHGTERLPQCRLRAFQGERRSDTSGQAAVGHRGPWRVRFT